MSTPYVTCAPRAVLGGSLVVVSQAFAPATVGCVVAGVAIGVIVIAVLAQLVALAFADLSLPAVFDWRAQHQLAALRWLPNMEMEAIARQSWAA